MDAERRAGETAPGAAAPPPEPRRERARRRGRSAGLHVSAVVAVVVVGLLVAWVAANRETVRVDWLVGSTDAALALVIFIAAALGWALGLVTSIAIRRRTRRRAAPPRPPPNSSP